MKVRLLAILIAVASSGCLEGLFDGECIPHFANGGLCEPACDASSVVIINGNNYCTSSCGELNECPGGHICARFGPSDIPDSACLPPCQSSGDCPSGFLGICSPEGLCGL